MIKLEKTQETPCSLSSVIDMWLRFGCQVKFLQNCILTGDLLKSKSKFASKVNTPNFPHDQHQNPRPLPGSIVDSGSSEIRDRGSTAPLAGPNAAPSPRRDTGGGTLSHGTGVLRRGQSDRRPRRGAKLCVKAAAARLLSPSAEKGATHLSRRQ